MVWHSDTSAQCGYNQPLPQPNFPGKPAGSGGGNEGVDAPTLILVCGQLAGPNCDITTGYDGLPLIPYYQLSTETPLIYGVDGTTKIAVAIAIYNHIKDNPGQYILVGHSAGGTALILAARMLQEGELGDQVSDLVLLDPYMDKNYPIDAKGTLGNIQDEANLIASSGITVFLGDSPGDGEDQSIAGAIEYETGNDVDHKHLATNYFIYNKIVDNPYWRP